MLRLRWLVLWLGCLTAVRCADAAKAFAQGTEPTQTAQPAVDAAKRAQQVEFFERSIRPLLARRCYECHGAASTPLQGGLRLDHAAAIEQGGDSGAAIDRAEPEKSRLLVAVRYADPQLQMPPEGKLPPEELAVLEEWHRQGAILPDDGALTSTRRGVDLAAGRRWWAFQPLAEQPWPAVSLPDWPRRKVDAFILAELEARELPPSPEADRATLLRRMTFDLTGLPPTPEDLANFVDDPAPDAYERQVERLLASPHYGERWGRFWLDLVRYCDVPEQWAQNGASPWLYRDWVVQALNDDLPYPTFVTRQLAADLEPDPQPRDIAALGLLGLSPSYWKELKLDHLVISAVVAEEWEERVNMLTSGLLAQTVACARCHDHKFDPFTMHDYYALAGVLASVRQTARPLLSASEAKVLEAAHQRVRTLEEKLKYWEVRAPNPPDLAWQLQLYRDEIAQLKQTPGYDAPLAFAVDEASLHVLPDGPHRTRLDYRPGEPQDVALQVRGNPGNLGPVVPRRFLQVLSSEPTLFRQGSGRWELAQAMFSDGGPLAARVLVNRLWKQHLGTALVDTPSNFGTQGSLPSHPALLEDLSARFVAAGWSWKWLHREIVLSATYRQSSAPRDDLSAQDPGNRWYGRASRRRLDVEAWRDAMLMATGQLSPGLGGPPLELGEPGNLRRTLYGTVRRRELHDLLRLFDFPDPTAHSPGREPTTTPLQQLFVLNSDLFANQSRALAERLLREGEHDAGRIERAYRWLYARQPTAGERRLGLEFLRSATPAADVNAWTRYCQVLLAENEFLFVD